MPETQRGRRYCCDDHAALGQRRGRRLNALDDEIAVARADLLAQLDAALHGGPLPVGGPTHLVTTAGAVLRPEAVQGVLAAFGAVATSLARLELGMAQVRLPEQARFVLTAHGTSLRALGAALQQSLSAEVSPAPPDGSTNEAARPTPRSQPRT